MKTSQIKFGALCFLVLLSACGKPAKEDTALPNEETLEAAEKNSNIQQGLHESLANDNVSNFNNVLKANFLTLKETKIGEDTLLIAAIKSNSYQIFEHLLRNGADVDETNRNGETPLIVAISQERPNENIIAALLQRPIKLNVKNSDGDTAFHIAIKRGLVDIANRLIERGVNINITDSNNETPYDLARNLSLETLETKLLQRLRVTLGTPDEVTFRKAILDLSQKDLVLMIREHPTVALTYEKINPLGLIIDASVKKEVEAKQLMQTLLTNIGGKTKISVNGPKEAEMPPIVHAAYRNNIILARTLTEYNPDYKLTDKNGRNALIHAIIHNNLAMTKLIFDNNPESKYKVKRPMDGKKVTFDACDVARDIGKKIPDPKKIKNDAQKAQAAKSAQESIKAIKEKLNCGIWNWLF